MKAALCRHVRHTHFHQVLGDCLVVEAGNSALKNAGNMCGKPKTFAVN